tara:strand:- start:6475 stop:6825 length:351 start_codon:yes stop_codon:yes gene_type:complete
VTASGAGIVVTTARVLHDIRVGDVCPEIASVPACVIVMVGHLILLSYALRFPKGSGWLFCGGVPALILPIFGFYQELVSPGWCKSSLPGGIPDCFLLPVISVLATLSFTLMRFGKR